MTLIRLVLVVVLNIVTVSQCLCYLEDTSSGSNKSQGPIPKTTLGLYAEFGGFGPSLLSLNIDVHITVVEGESSYSQLGLRLGYTISFYDLRTIPIILNGSYGRRHRLEYGIGVVAYPVGPKEFNLSETALKPSLQIGWRYQELGGGLLLRGVITGTYDTGIDRFYPLFGISVGYQFQFN